MDDADIATPDASRSFWKSFGPGLMWAGTAIGVSHLVQSTRAGASAGFAFAGVIFFALLLKFPFFDFAPRYSAATGMSLVEGYKRVGRWALWLYFLIVVTTVVPTVSAIVLLNSFLLQFAFGLSGSTMPIVVALFVVIGGLLWVGHFKLLDLSMKLVLLVLSVCTLIGAAMVLPRVSFATFSLSPLPLRESVVPYAFLLALAGWMPSDIAVSVYASLWTLAKDESTGGRTSVRNARLDFLIGYVGTAILAFAFLTLGAGVMFGSGVALSDSGGVFATQLVNLYSSTLGTWIRPIMMVSAVTAIFSTSLGVLDGFPRVLERCWNVLRTDDMRAVGRIPSGRPVLGVVRADRAAVDRAAQCLRGQDDDDDRLRDDDGVPDGARAGLHQPAGDPLARRARRAPPGPGDARARLDGARRAHRDRRRVHRVPAVLIGGARACATRRRRISIGSSAN